MFTDDLTGAGCILGAVARDWEAGRGDSDVMMRELGQVQRYVDAITVRVAKDVEDSQSFVGHGDRSAADFCARMMGVDRSSATRAIASANRLGSLPGTAAAFRAGELSARKVELLSKVAVHDPSLETELLEQAGKGLIPLRDACNAAEARTEDLDARSARQHAARSFRMWAGDGGMIEGRFSVTPEVGGRIKAVMDGKTGDVFRTKSRAGVRQDQDKYAADAFAELMLGPSTGRVGYTVQVVIDHAVLVRGNALPGERCEIPGSGPVSRTWVRELVGGDAAVNAIVKKAKDIRTVAHLGRSVPAAVRTALLVEGRECSVQDCYARGYLELDHSEVDFAKGGPTAKSNLGWLCSTHHSRKSKGSKLGPPDPESGKRVLVPLGRAEVAYIGTPRPEIGRAARRAQMIRNFTGTDPPDEVP